VWPDVVVRGAATQRPRDRSSRSCSIVASWAGLRVHVHEKVERAGWQILRCSKTGTTSDRWLEDSGGVDVRLRRLRPGAHRLGAPGADVGALSALAELLRTAKPVSASSVSSAASSPREDSSARSQCRASRRHCSSICSLSPHGSGMSAGTTVWQTLPAQTTSDVDVADRAPAAGPRRRSRRGVAGDAR